MHLPLRLVPLLLLAAALAGCGRPPADAEACEGRLPGDVVLTELMKDPEGTDTGKEYVELYNATGLPVALDGLELYAARADGTQERRHRLAGAPVLPPGGYLALGDVRAEGPLPAHLGHAYGEALGNLPNAGGRVGVRCGERVLDEVRYGEAGRAGAARELDGTRPPDAQANDDEAHFCDAREPFAEGALGSPGRPNAPCAGPADAGETGTLCTDARTGTRRPVRTPREGELVLTEVMANPAAVDDAAGEWVELHSARAVDLHGLTLGTEGTAGGVLQGEGCLAVEAGEHVLLARRAEPALNGGLPPVRATFTQPLANGGGTLVLRAGGQVVDALTYPPRGTGEAGVASQLPAGRLAATDNDAVGALCDATTLRGGGERGTPGAPNTACAEAPDAGARGCLDVERGVRRPSVPPAVGDVVLHEVMADPLGADSDREYVELYVERDVDLHGVSLASGAAAGRTALAPEACLPVRAGSHVLLAREEDAALNGGLPVPQATFGFSLGNAAEEGEPDRAVQLWLGELLLDEVRYRTSSEGVAAQLRPHRRSPAGNDAADAFCTSAGAPRYGEGGVGTPGAANVCP